MEALRAKITSEEQWAKVWKSLSREQKNDALAVLERIDVMHNLTWATLREASRYALVYERTEELDRAPPSMFAHVSLEDRNMVAYTPDLPSLLADRQIRLAPGKFFRKAFPVHSDAFVQRLAEEHLASANLTLVFYTGDDITAAYIAADERTHSCMSGKPRWAVHPTVAYNMDGIALACLVDARGAIRARCMTHTQTGRKVAIRYYGQAGLRTRLEAEGYRLGTWEGVKLKAVQKDDAWIFPYLDSMGGPNDGERVVLSGPAEAPYLYVPPKDMVEGFRPTYTVGVATYCRSETTAATCGYVELFRAPPNSPGEVLKFSTREVITDLAAEILAGYTEVVYGREGQMLLCTPGEKNELLQDLSVVRALRYDTRSDQTKPVMADKTCVVVTDGGEVFLDEESTLSENNLVDLDPVIYGDRVFSSSAVWAWVPSEESSTNFVQWYIKLDDSATVITILNGQVAERVYHKNFLPEKELYDVSSITEGSVDWASRDAVCLKNGEPVGVAGYDGFAFARDIRETVDDFHYLDIWDSRIAVHKQVEEIPPEQALSLWLEAYTNHNVRMLLRRFEDYHDLGPMGSTWASAIASAISLNSRKDVRERMDAVGVCFLNWLASIPPEAVNGDNPPTVGEVLSKFPIYTPAAEAQQ